VKCESNIKTKDAGEAKEWEETRTNPSSESIVLKPGLAQWVDLGPSRPGAGTGPGWRKKMERKNLMWAGWPGQDPVANPLTFDFFFTKTTSFWFFLKKMTRPIRWPGQNPEPGPWTRPGLKPTSDGDKGGVCLFFWVMSVLLSLARGIKDARQAEEWEIKLKLGWNDFVTSLFSTCGTKPRRPSSTFSFFLFFKAYSFN